MTAANGEFDKTRQERKRQAQKEMEERVAEDPSEAARYYHRLVVATKKEFKSLKRQHAEIANAEMEHLNLNSKLADLEQEKADLESQIAKASRRTRLVICMQNSVRKMLQEKLEQRAEEIEALRQTSTAALAEAQDFKLKAVQLEKDAHSAKEKMTDLTESISAVRSQLEEAEKQKQ